MDMSPIAYIEPPTIPAGMTVADYRRMRGSQRKSLATRLRTLLSPQSPRLGL